MLEVIFKYATGDLTARGTLFDDNSALDGVMAGINILGEELEAYVAENKRAQEASLESENRLRTVLESVQAGIVIIDPEVRRIVDVNSFAARMIGAPKESIVGAECHKFICPAECDQCPVTDLHQTVDNSERVLLTATGERRDIIKTVTTIQFGGRPHLLESFIDVTERKRAEEKMRSASLYARSLIEASLDPLATISVAGAIMDVNEAAAQMTGVPRERLTGSDFSAYFTEPDKAHAAYQEAFTKGAVRNYPLTMRHVSGKLTEVLYNASVYHNEKGELAGVLAVARDITERNRAEQAEELARRDGLTGLYNHRTFYSFLNDEMIRAQRHNRPVSLLMLDIDHFKRVNDTYGHLAGDAILKGLGDLLAQQARAVDRVCRYGGEEIMVILPETDAPMAMGIAERLRMEVAQQPFDIGGGKIINITVSIGVATYPRQVNSLGALVKAADVALYVAKQGGRNQVCRYETERAADDSSA